MLTLPVLLMTLVSVLVVAPGAPAMGLDDETGAAPAADDAAPMAMGRDCTQRFYDSDLDSLWDECSTTLQGALGTIEGLQGFRAAVQEQMGAEKAVVTEEIMRLGALRTYLRTSRFEKTDLLIQVSWVFGDDLGIEGFSIRPIQVESESEYLGYETKATFRLPFDEEWFVVWGGRTLAQNYHAYTVDQRFAYDILIVQGGKTHAGEGKDNEDYYAYGKRVLAPADGLVFDAGDDRPDNAPGVMDPANPLGNFVILDHGNDEYTLMAHFRQGSVAVKKGDRVKAGDFLGLCGNSGNTTEPHIHIHLQDTPVFSAGKGKPIQFTDYRANGVLYERGEPVKGQAVRPKDAPPTSKEPAGVRSKDAPPAGDGR